MKPVVHLSQSRLQHVRVNLRGGQVGVSEERLDGAEVRAAVEQVCGEGVAQYVGRERPADAGPLSARFQDLPEADAAQPLAAMVDKQPRRRVAARQPGP